MPLKYQRSFPGTLGAVCLVGLLLSSSRLAAATYDPQKRALPQVGFSVPRALCDGPFTVRLISPLNEAAVRYTLNGSEPTLNNGADYIAPLLITNTTLLRAAAFKNGSRVSAVGTHSYIFLDHVLRQPSAPPGFPAGPRAWVGQRSAYQMDPRVVDHPVYRDRIKDAFRSLRSFQSFLGRRTCSVRAVCI